MKTVQVTDKAVTIQCSGEEAPTGSSLRKLVRRVLAENGCEPWPGMEAECFEAEGDVLVIVRPGAVRRAFFFPGTEELCAAEPYIPAGETALYRVRDGFLLTLAAETCRSGLYEFGEAVCLSGGWEEHAREQGLCLAERDAAAYLRRQLMT